MHRRWIGIRASAVLAIAGSLATLLFGGVMLFGIWVAPRPAPGPGWGGLIVYTIFAAAQIYLGAGLLYLQEPARLGSIGYFCLTALSSILNVAPPGLAAKMETLQRAMPKLFPNGTTATMPQPGWVFALMGIAIAAVPVWFLVRQRAAFVTAAPAE